MDTIRFTIEEYVSPERSIKFPTINIYINGQNLIHLVDQVEHARSRVLRGDEGLGQNYVGLNPEYHWGFRDEFLGRTGRLCSILLICTCQEELCNSIIGRILLKPDTVIWSEIRSPFLGIEPAPWVQFADAEQADFYPIDYSSLGPFVFEREQYMAALSDLELSA